MPVCKCDGCGHVGEAMAAFVACPSCGRQGFGHNVVDEPDVVNEEVTDDSESAESLLSQEHTPVATVVAQVDSAPKEIDTNNEFKVGEVNGHIMVLRSLPVRMTKPQALRLAAWLVAIADDENEFEELLNAVLST